MVSLIKTVIGTMLNIWIKYLIFTLEQNTDLLDISFCVVFTKYIWMFCVNKIWLEWVNGTSWWRDGDIRV